MEEEKKPVVEETTQENQNTSNLENPIENAGEQNNSNIEDDTDIDFQNSDDLDNVKVPNENNQQKRQSARKDKKYAEIRLNTIKEICPTNTYTGEPIENDDDFEEFKIMQEMEKQDLDPLNTLDYRKFKKAKEAEAKALEEEQQRIAKESNVKAKQKFDSELNEFSQNHPNVNLNNWFNEIPQERKGLTNEQNQQFLKDKMDVFNAFVKSGMSISEAYDLFNRVNANLNIDIANKIAQQKIQNSLASPGSLTGSSIEETIETPDYKNMDGKEFDEIWKKVVNSAK